MRQPPGDSFRVDFPRLLREREKTLRAFAKSIGVSQPYLSQVIAGDSNVTPSLLKLAAMKLKVQPERWPEYREMVTSEAIRRDPDLCRRVYAELPPARVRGVPESLRKRIFRDLQAHPPRSYRVRP